MIRVRLARVVGKAFISIVINIDDFTKIDMRVGTIKSAFINEKAKKRAYKLEIDLGELGTKWSSAQITDIYTPEDLIGKIVVTVVNFKPIKIGDIYSEVLVLGVDSDNGVILLGVDKDCDNGKRVY